MKRILKLIVHLATWNFHVEAMAHGPVTTKILRLFRAFVVNESH